MGRREMISKVLGAATLLGGAAAANADIDYAGVGFLGGSSTIDVNNANIRVYTKVSRHTAKGGLGRGSAADVGHFGSSACGGAGQSRRRGRRGEGREDVEPFHPEIGRLCDGRHPRVQSARACAYGTSEPRPGHSTRAWRTPLALGASIRMRKQGRLSPVVSARRVCAAAGHVPQRRGQDRLERAVQGQGGRPATALPATAGRADATVLHAQPRVARDASLHPAPCGWCLTAARLSAAGGHVLEVRLHRR